MSTPVYEVVKPQVSLRMYLPEVILLLASFATPLLAWAISGSGSMMGRSGRVMVFFVAVAEFVLLNRANKKHIVNGCRVKAKETPWDSSHPATALGITSLIAGLLGTLIWGYGDLVLGR